MQQPFSHLAGKHKGKPIVVMGGAPCLVDDMEKLKGLDAIYISINYHAATAYHTDYITALDKTVGGKDYIGWLKESFDIPIISVQPGADFKTEPMKMGVTNSGIYSLWVADVMGGYPIITAGFELYQGDSQYFDDPTVKKQSQHEQSGYVDKFVGSVKEMCDTSKIRAVSNVLTDHFKPYNEKEKLASYKDSSHLLAENNKRYKLVTFTENFRIEGQLRLKGQSYWLTERNAKHCLMYRKAYERSE